MGENSTVPPCSPSDNTPSARVTTLSRSIPPATIPDEAIEPSSAGSLFGYAIESDFPLRRLRSEPGPRGLLRVRRGDATTLGRPGELLAWLDGPGADAAPFALARTSEGPIVWSGAIGGFLAAADRQEIWADAEFGTGELWEHRLVTTAVPLLLTELGDLVLHAAAVEIGGSAVLFCGDTGRGKTTLALALARRGHAVLTEDGTSVDLSGGAPVAWPGPLGFRPVVEPVAAAGSPHRKRTVFPSGIAPARAVEVGAVVLLRERTYEALRLEEVEPVAAAVPTLVASAIRASEEGLKRVFSLVVRLADAVPVLECAMPDDLGKVDAAAAELADRLSRSVLSD